MAYSPNKTRDKKIQSISRLLMVQYEFFLRSLLSKHDGSLLRHSDSTFLSSHFGSGSNCKSNPRKVTFIALLRFSEKICYLSRILLLVHELYYYVFYYGLRFRFGTRSGKIIPIRPGQKVPSPELEFLKSLWGQGTEEE
jgi:hypothetical protein